MRMRKHLVTITLGGLSLSACVAGPAPEIATPTPELPPEFHYSAGVDEKASIAALLPNDDMGFRSLAAAAIESGPSLAEAIARVEAARAGAARVGAERLPNIGLDASVDRRRSNPSQFGSNVPAAIQFDREQTGYSANLTARWDADVFGAERRQLLTYLRRAQPERPQTARPRPHRCAAIGSRGAASTAPAAPGCAER